MLAVLLPDERAEVIDRTWRADVEACKLAAEHWSFTGWRDARLQKVGKDIKEHEAQIASLQRDREWLTGLQTSAQPQETRCVCGDVLAWRETSNGYFCTNMQCDVREARTTRDFRHETLRVGAKIDSGLSGFDGVVPFRHDAVRCDAQLSHLGVGDLDAGLVGLPHEVRAHAVRWRCGWCAGSSGWSRSVEGAARPVLADFAEQAVFNGVPLRLGGRVMGHGDAQAVAGKGCCRLHFQARAVELLLPPPSVEEQALSLRIVVAALGAPPLLDAVDGERRGVGLPRDGAGMWRAGRRCPRALGIGGEVVVGVRGCGPTSRRDCGRRRRVPSSSYRR